MGSRTRRARRAPARILVSAPPGYALRLRPGCPWPACPAADAAALIRSVYGGPVDEHIVQALGARTGGNPFYLTESAKLLASEGALVAVSEVPEGVRDVLRRRLSRLPPPAVAVLRLAATAGQEADVEVLVDAIQAAERADRRYAYDAAVFLLEQALDASARGTGTTSDRAEQEAGLLGRLLRAQIRAGRIAAARATRQRAADAAAAAGRDDLVLQPERRAALAAEIGRIGHEHGLPEYE